MADSTKLIYYSEWNYQKIHLQGNTTLSYSAGFADYTATIIHGLGYKPNVRIWLDWGDGLIQDARDDDFDYALSTIVRDTTIVVRLSNYSGSSGNLKIYYRIYA